MIVSLFKTLGLHNVIRLRFKDLCEPEVKVSGQRDPSGIKLVIHRSGAFSSILDAFSVYFGGVLRNLIDPQGSNCDASLGMFQCELYPKL